MQRELYPPEWEEIAGQIKADAGYCCEGCGKQCRRPGEALDTHQRTLTVAHINHTPADCSRANLIALCAPCHLKYDAPAKRLRAITRKRAALMDTNTQLVSLLATIAGKAPRKPKPIAKRYGFDQHGVDVLESLAELNGLEGGPPAALARAVTLLKVCTEAVADGAEIRIHHPVSGSSLIEVDGVNQMTATSGAEE
jgi:hypothetical protein